ncbi:reverse transcriptase [Cucumis melo var. makuwa]|uniref:Reverse transcriptase n=2 Tax=Cucumis melo TaxID=3656 RepID=A0A5A7VIA0_CUCMM|nr:reverse transcriptase [Cucumis melo var. makuwa]TYK28014.1 reverse transcriptase [Cucumis melo var. makuwa]
MEGTVFHSWIRDSLLKKEGEAPQTTRDQISHTFGDVEERAWSGQTEVQILPSIELFEWNFMTPSKCSIGVEKNDQRDLDYVLVHMDEASYLGFLLGRLIPMPLAQSLVVRRSNLNVVQAKIKQWGENENSPVRLSPLVVPFLDEQIEAGSVQVEIQKVLNEYVDIMQRRPCPCGIDHEIELVPRAKPPAQNAYQMA